MRKAMIDATAMPAKNQPTDIALLTAIRLEG
jgi:hypothetical protein